MAVDVPKVAFAEGRLDQTEYADRVAVADKSRTCAELARRAVRANLVLLARSCRVAI